MTDATPTEEPIPKAAALPETAGERLREAREAQGLTLDEVAARTRISVRQLGAIEQADYAALPSITYSVGFAKAYARAVGLDEVEIGREVRGISAQAAAAPRREAEIYTLDEPTARVPTRGLALGALAVALLVVIGAALWFGTTLFRDGGDAPAATATTENSVPEAPAAPPSAAPAAASGPVVLTATDEVWLKVYTADKTLFQDTLKPGEHYEVPADAASPMINVGRPDKLQVTVGGTAVAPLGDGRVAIKDVGISAAALTARGAPQPAPSASLEAATREAPTRGAEHRSVAPRERRPAAAATSSALNIAAPAPTAPEPAAPAPAATPAP